LNFLKIFSKKKISYIKYITKILPVGADLFYADEQTDGRDEANSFFSQLRESV